MEYAVAGEPSSFCKTKELNPCNTLSLPQVIVAALLPISLPLPIGSIPTILTGSSRNASNIPIALDPPPTQAQTTLRTVTFAKADYYADEDIAQLETPKKKTSFKYVKLNKTVTIPKDEDNEHSFVFECKKDGVYKFVVDSDSFVQYSLYEFSKTK